MSLTRKSACVGLVMMLAAGLLSWLVLHTEVLFADGLRYIRQAQALDRGGWAEGLAQAVDHPVYPVSIAVAHRLIGGEGPMAWQAAAQGASATAGVLLIAPLFLVASELFGPGAAVLACFLTFLVPLTGHVFADTLSESTFLLFWTWGLWGAPRFLRQGRPLWLLLVITGAGLAYLTRPEGLLLPAALVAALGLIPLIRPLRMERRRWWLAIGLLLIGPTCLVGPYIAIKGGIGTKPSIARLLGTAPRSPAQAVERQRPLEPGQSALATSTLAAEAVYDAVREAVTTPLLCLSVVGLLGLVVHRPFDPARRVAGFWSPSSRVPRSWLSGDCTRREVIAARGTR